MTDHDLGHKTNEMAEWLRGMTREKLREMGVKGEKTIQEGYTKEIVMKKYVELIDSLFK